MSIELHPSANFALLPFTIPNLTLFQTLAAANVYHAIVRGVEDARRTALAAFEAAGAAVSRAEDRGSGDNLGVRAELSRVRSEDLFQVCSLISSCTIQNAC